MFLHKKELQYHAKPERPDPIMARRLQEILGGQWGEMSVMNMYLFQGWNARGNDKYKDLLLDTATEEIGHGGNESSACDRFRLRSSSA